MSSPSSRGADSSQTMRRFTSKAAIKRAAQEKRRNLLEEKKRVVQEKLLTAQ
jgi:hypothetical protein